MHAPNYLTTFQTSNQHRLLHQQTSLPLTQTIMPVFRHLIRHEMDESGYTICFQAQQVWREAPWAFHPHHNVKCFIVKQDNTRGGNWDLPVSELTSMINWHYRGCRKICLGSFEQPLLLKGSQQEFLLLAATLKQYFKCKVLVFAVRLTPQTPLHVVSPAPLLQAFRLLSLKLCLDHGTRLVEEVVPLLQGGLFCLTVDNPLTAEQCLSLARPAGGRNNSTLRYLDLHLTVEPDVENTRGENMLGLKRSTDTGAAQSGKKLAHLLFHFKNLKCLVIRGSRAGLSFLKSLLTELLAMLQNQQGRPQNREGLSAFELELRFPDLSVLNLSDDCKGIVMDFIDSWNRCPVRFSFKGMLRDPFDKAHTFRSSAKSVVFDQKLHEPNNQHYEKFLEATSLTPRTKRWLAQSCDIRPEHDLIAPSLRFELLRLYPNMMKPRYPPLKKP